MSKFSQIMHYAAVCDSSIFDGEEWKTTKKEDGKGRHYQIDTATGVITKGFGAGKTPKEAFNPEPKTERQKVGRKISEAGAKKFGGSEREYRNLGTKKGQADSFAREYLKSGNVPEGHLRDAVKGNQKDTEHFESESEKSTAKLNQLKESIKSKYKLTERQQQKIFNNVNKDTVLNQYGRGDDIKYALNLGKPGEGKGFIKLNEKEYQAAKELQQLLINKHDTGDFEQNLEGFREKVRWGDQPQQNLPEKEKQNLINETMSTRGDMIPENVEKSANKIRKLADEYGEKQKPAGDAAANGGQNSKPTAPAMELTPEEQQQKEKYVNANAGLHVFFKHSSMSDNSFKQSLEVSKWHKENWPKIQSKEDLENARKKYKELRGEVADLAILEQRALQNKDPLSGLKALAEEYGVNNNLQANKETATLSSSSQNETSNKNKERKVANPRYTRSDMAKVRKMAKDRYATAKWDRNESTKVKDDLISLAGKFDEEVYNRLLDKGVLGMLSSK